MQLAEAGVQASNERENRMRILRNNGTKLAGAVTLLGVVIVTLYACITAWAAPGLSMAVLSSNRVSITVTNGVTNGVYQIYYREFLDTNYEWQLFSNGAPNQTNFVASMEDTESGFFEAAYNPSFVPPTITVIIQSPTNGALIY
jgi:hypothetical protein